MKKQNSLLLGQPQVVGVIHDWNDYMAARALSLDVVDMFELRGDEWLFPPEHHLTQEVLTYGKPIIFTPRDEAEGGKHHDWSVIHRAGLLYQYMRSPAVKCIDLELKHAGKFIGVIQEARTSGIAIILSGHDFDRTPSVAELMNWADDCRRLGGNVLKIAVLVKNVDDALILQDAAQTIRLAFGDLFKVAVMPIGDAFAFLRYLDAAQGSPFIYTGLATRSSGQPWAKDAKREFKGFQSRT